MEESLAVAVLIVAVLGWLGARGFTLAQAERARRSGASEVRGLVSALYEELVILQMQAASFAEELARQMRDEQRRGWNAARLERSRLTAPFAYPAVAGRLHLLPDDTSHRIRYFHLMLSDARRRADPLLAGGDMLGEPYLLLRTLTTAANTITPTLREMELCLGRSHLRPPKMPTADLEVERLEEGNMVEPVRLDWIYWPTLFAG